MTGTSSCANRRTTESHGRRYVFATFGEVNWVRNLRAAREAVIRRGGRIAPWTLYGLSQESSAANYLTEARRHPVFELLDPR
jgi:hypothetical protein